MPIGYLVTVVLVAWCTLAALGWLPSAIPGTARYWFALIPSELPFLALYYLAASTLLAFAQGSVRSPGGWIGVAAAGVTASGPVLIVRRSLRARDAVSRALAEGLAANRPRAAEPAEPLRIGPIMTAPLFARRGGVERVADVRYGDAGRCNLLDIYRHRSHSEDCPALIHLHGGRFRHGAKNRQAIPLLYHLAARGWICISANYRLLPDGAFPNDLIDVKRVIAWMRAEGGGYGIDGSRIFVAGSSAGGHLASMAALTPNDAGLQPGFEAADTSVAGAIALGAYFGPRGTYRPGPSSPTGAVNQNAPPFLVAHGDGDTIVPVQSARGFVEKLRRASASPVVYIELPGAQHSFDLFHSVRFDAVIDAIGRFTSAVQHTVPR